MRSYSIIIGLLCAFIFGALGAQTGFTYSTTIPFVLSLSLVAYAGLASPTKRSGPITFDRLTQF